jgi:hypothetical protein
LPSALHHTVTHCWGLIYVCFCFWWDAEYISNAQFKALSICVKLSVILSQGEWRGLLAFLRRPGAEARTWRCSS